MSRITRTLVTIAIATAAAGVTATPALADNHTPSPGTGFTTQDSHTPAPGSGFTAQDSHTPITGGGFTTLDSHTP